MNFIATKADLYAAVARAVRAASAHGGAVVTSNVLIDAGDGGVTLRATDYDMTIVARLDAEVVEPGQAAVCAKALHDTVRALPSRPVSVVGLGGGSVELQCARSRFKIVGVDPADFPEYRAREQSQRCDLPIAPLLEGLAKTSFCMSTDQSRLAINGVHMEIAPLSGRNGALLTMVATDGHRMTVFEREIEHSAVVEPFRSTIHRRAATEIPRVFDGYLETLAVSATDSDLRFEAGGASLVVRQIGEPFPDYRKVIPDHSQVTTELNRLELIESIRRVATVQSGAITFGLGDGKVVLAANHVERGEGSDELDAEHAGEPITVGMNHRYVLDALQAIEAEFVRLTIIDTVAPIVVRPASGEGLLCIVMPLRVGG